jgi:hypothetical protein
VDAQGPSAATRSCFVVVSGSTSIILIFSCISLVLLLSCSRCFFSILLGRVFLGRSLVILDRSLVILDSSLLVLDSTVLLLESSSVRSKVRVRGTAARRSQQVCQHATHGDRVLSPAATLPGDHILH